MGAEGSFERTLAALHGAALEEANPLSATALVNEACGARGHALILGEGHSAREEKLFLLGFCYGRQRRDDWETVYLRDYLHRDERVPRIAQLPYGRARLSDCGPSR